MPAILFPPTSPLQVPGPPALPRKRVAILNRALAMGANSNGGGSGDSNYLTSRSQITCRNVATAVTGIRVWFGNWTLTGGAVEVPGANPITVTASLQYPYGTFNRFFWRNANSITIQPGDTVVSDPLPVTVPANTLCYIRNFVSVASAGMTWPRGQTVVVSGLGEASEEGAALTDNTLGGAYSGLNYNCFGPLAVDGYPMTPMPSVLLVGDSISWGQGDDSTGVSTTPTGDGLGNYGFAQRQLYNSGIGFHKMVKSGLYARDITAANYRCYMVAEAAGTAHVLLGTNDLGFGGLSYTAIAGFFQEIWNKLAAHGCRVIACTIPPRTTSTDNWATTGNQSFYNTSYGTASSPRGQLNALIRSLPSPLSGYLEYADALETGRDTGMWKPGWTNDGVHPNGAYGHPAMMNVLQSAINAGMLV